MKLYRTFGIILLILGVAALVACILVAFSVGTMAVPILLFSSIFANSAGIMLLRKGK